MPTKKDLDKPRGVNRRLLRRIQKHILEEPKRVFMDNWLLRSANPADRGIATFARVQFPSCGTVACIAGWAVTLLAKCPDSGLFDGEFQGANVLGLDENQASVLFYSDDWPIRFRRRLAKVRQGTKAYAQVVSDRIDYFLEHGE